MRSDISIKKEEFCTRSGATIRLRACLNIEIESVHKICRQNLSKIKLCDWPNKLDATSWQV